MAKKKQAIQPPETQNTVSTGIVPPEPPPTMQEGVQPIGGIEPPPKPPVMEATDAPPDNQDGRNGKIGKEDIDKAAKLLETYKKCKSSLQARVIENEQWWKLRHWEQMRASGNGGNATVDPASAWLFNSVTNKHADAMDNFPEPNILPREEQDKQDAAELSSILPVILEQNEYEQTYSDTWWDKIKNGTGVKGVFWNSQKQNGLGDIEIRQIDLLNIFWEPGITNIQDSTNVFTVSLTDNEMLKTQYPSLADKLSGITTDLAKYQYDDEVPTDGKSAVVDWYYKRTSPQGKSVLHYCKFCNGELLYSSENTQEFQERGFYDHGEYPFVFDTLFPEKGTPCGFGYIDIMKDPQMYIDKLDGVILENALQSGKPRYFGKSGGNVNEEEFLDWSKPIVHVSGDIDGNLKPITTPQLPAIVPNVRQMKIEELKETSGNRDFSQGGTASGVTAASAIAALQEAGSKLSRDMIKSAYRSFSLECTLAIELIRQFYDEPRCFRITGKMGEESFTSYDNGAIKTQEIPGDFGGEATSRMPVFDIKVKAQRSNPFSTAAQNEIMKELYQLQFFNPSNADQALLCLEGMTIEGKESMMQKISQNGTLFQQVQQLQQQVMMMASMIDQRLGGNLTQQAAMQVNEQQQGAPGQASPSTQPTGGESGVTANARERTAQSASVR